MICHSHRFVFVHIPKTGGSSVEKMLLRECSLDEGAEADALIIRNRLPWRGPPWLQHLTSLEYLNHGYVSPQHWKSFYKFSVVRNPWARAVSEYNARGRTRFMKMFGLAWNFRNFLLLGRSRWFEDNHLRGTDNYRHMIPQSRFLLDENGQLAVDEVVRLEDFSSGGFDVVFRSLGLDRKELPRSNRSIQRDPKDGARTIDGKRLSYQDYYDDELRDVVARRYAKDIELLGYTFE
ncbi:MAG: sulfotransferase family 2 domain-containing protein [Planctomycetota bacterium]